MTAVTEGFGSMDFDPDAAIAKTLKADISEIDSQIGPLQAIVQDKEAWLRAQFDQINAEEAEVLARLQADWELEIVQHLGRFEDGVARLEQHRLEITAEIEKLQAELREANERISAEKRNIDLKRSSLEAERDEVFAARRDGYEAQRREREQQSRIGEARQRLANLQDARHRYERRLDSLQGRRFSVNWLGNVLPALGRPFQASPRRAVGLAVLISLVLGLAAFNGGSSSTESSVISQPKAPSVSLQQVTGHVQATGTPAWLPDTVKVWAPKLDRACRTQAVASHGLNLSCSVAYRPILLTLALLDSAGNPHYVDPETGRQGLEPLDAKNGRAVAKLLHLRYQPFDGLTSLKIAARALNMDAYSGLTSGADLSRYSKLGAVDVSTWCTTSVKHTGPAAVAFDLAHFWHPSYSCQYDAAVAQMFLDWKKPASPVFSANFSTPGMQQRLAEAMTALKKANILS